MAYYQKLWLDYQQRIFQPPQINTRYKKSIVDISTGHLFLVSCIFEDISNRAITAEGDIPSIVAFTSFCRISHPEQYGAFFIKASGKANIGFEKDCFINCSSKSAGVGVVKAGNAQRISIVECVTTLNNNPGQSDTLGIHGAIQCIKYVNSSNNNVGTVPHVTIVDAVTCEMKLCTSAHNSASDFSSTYVAYGNANIHLSIFKDNIMSSSGSHATVVARDATVCVLNCDFIQNQSPLFHTLNATITCKWCFFDANSGSISYNDVLIDSTSVSNIEEIWVVDRGVCHQQVRTCRGAKKQMAIFLAFALSK